MQGLVELIYKIIERTTLHGSAAQASAPVSVSVTVSAETDMAHSALVSVTAETEKSGFGRPLVWTLMRVHETTRPPFI